MTELKKTTFNVPKMDCPSEEKLVRMALEGRPGIQTLTFDLGTRRLFVLHDSAPNDVLRLLTPLGFGAEIALTEKASGAPTKTPEEQASDDAGEGRVLKQLLAINATMFVVELGLGWIAQSTGLIADSLDMFSDAAVYALSLYAVGRSIALKRRSARISGIFQLFLALGAFTEVVRRFFAGSEPQAPMMMGVAALALAANVTCLWLLAKHRKGEVHMKASWIFSTNDVIANLGVIVAGVLVNITQSPVPDLVVGAVIGSVVFSGALRILRLSKG